MNERDEFLQKEEAQSGELFEKLRDKVKRRNRRIFLTAAIVAALLLSVALFFGVKRFFSVKEITVSGSTAYETERIINESGIRKGKAIFLFSSGKARARILEKFPMLEEATVKKIYPSTVVITVSDESPLYLYDTGEKDIGYAVVAHSEKLLSFYLTREEAEKENPGLITVQMPQIKNAVRGEKLKFFSSGDAGYLPTLIDLLRGSAFSESAHTIDARSRFDLKILCGNREDGRPKWVIELGNKNKLREKLDFAAGILESLGEDFEGVISVEDVRSGYARKYTD